MKRPRNLKHLRRMLDQEEIQHEACEIMREMDEDNEVAEALSSHEHKRQVQYSDWLEKNNQEIFCAFG